MSNLNLTKMSIREKLNEMESDINALKMNIADWKTALADFDEKWETQIKLHNEQRETIIRSMEQNIDTLEKLSMVHEQLKKKTLITELEGDFADTINEYVSELGITMGLAKIVKCLVHSEEQSEELENCTFDSFQKVVNQFTLRDLEIISNFIKQADYFEDDDCDCFCE